MTFEDALKIYESAWYEASGDLTWYDDHDDDGNWKTDCLGYLKFIQFLNDNYPELKNET